MPVRLYLICFFLVLAPTRTWAQPVDLPTPEMLFEQAAKAIGWNSEAKDVGRIEASANVTVEGRTYDTVVTSGISTPAGGDARFTMISEDGTVTYGDTDGTIWFEGEDGERRTLTPAMAAFVHGHQFHRRALFPASELQTIDREVTIEEFADELAFTVSGTTPAGARLKYFFSQRSKRMIGFHLVVEEEAGPHPMDFILKDWRTSGGETLFWRIDINDRGKIYVYRFNRILLLP
ncbi:hypothetical protein ACFO5Q_14305 [Kordiimonas lipolytica]|uniref:Outer membrane lipoprotein-sorting protein n=1 Tax=Kordiimonas lipolytica TaxID=1662421 RepID=A0ABV8UE45_9PROT|nr:hypothetical protein [Kordiimonas lipolytica]